MGMEMRRSRYKPSLAHYYNALRNELESSYMEMNKLIFLLVRYLGHPEMSMIIRQKQRLHAIRSLYASTMQLISWQTPESFMKIFPVTKQYYGEKGCDNDGYYSSMRALEKIGINTNIGENVYEILFSYRNTDVNLLMQNYLELMDALSGSHVRMFGINGAKSVSISEIEYDKTLMEPLLSKIIM